MTSSATRLLHRTPTPWLRLMRLPAGVFLLLLAITIVLWQQESREQRMTLVAHVGTDQIHAARRLELVTASTLAPLQTLSQKHTGRLPTEREYAQAVSLLTDGAMEFDLLAYADARRICHFTFPQQAELIGTDLSRHEQFGLLYDYASGRPRQASSLLDRSDPARLRLMVFMPVGALEDGIADGAIIAVSRIDPILRRMFVGSISDAYAMELRDDAGVFFTLQQPSAHTVASPEALHVLEKRWWLSLKPTDRYIADWSGREPKWVFFGGVMISLLMSAVVLQMMHHRWRDAEVTRRHVSSLESVNQIAAAIGAAPASRAELLKRLADEPRHLLGVTRSFISLFEPELDRVRLVAASSNDALATEFPDTYSASETPAMRMSMHERRVIVSNDVERDAAIFNMESVRSLSIRSLMMIPLIGRDRVIGLWTITCDRPHAFRNVEVQLAGLWASQIALTLVNGHYFDEMNQAMRAQQKLAAQRDMLAAVNAAIFQAATVEESTQKIAELAPQALNVDMCMANLLTRPGELTVVTATGAYAHQVVGSKFPIENTNAQRVLQSRQMLVIEDARNDPTLHPRFREILRVQSIVYLPLFKSDRSPIGLLTLVSHSPRDYDAEQRRLMEIFGRRAAAALENVILHQQARRDAETKAMLLRELNHRVKNNLAGIISLLTVGQSDLPERARQWIDRTVDRIATIARAHDLFTGGVGKVALDRLVAQVLPSLSVVKPAGVEIRTDILQGATFLRTDRAVNLAMVLHELCYNGIVHGAQSGGIVSVIARAIGNEQRLLRIEVVNDAASSNTDDLPLDAGGSVAMTQRRAADLAQARDAASGGIGLPLVGGLVRRELRGSFTVGPRGNGKGGTIAIVEFPLLPDESQEEDVL